jgi:hypothetical protein
VTGYFELGEATGGSGYLMFLDCAAAGRVDRKSSVAVKRTAYFIVHFFYTYINERKDPEVWSIPLRREK